MTQSGEIKIVISLSLKGLKNIILFIHGIQNMSKDPVFFIALHTKRALVVSKANIVLRLTNMNFKEGDLVRMNRAIVVGRRTEAMAYMGIVWELIEDRTLNRGRYKIKILKPTNEFTKYFFELYPELPTVRFMTENKEDMELVN